MSSTANRKRILVVEDEISLREAYVMILQHEGFEVYEASNGIEGLKELKLRKPDVVLLDIFMPVMDGITFLKNFNKQENPNSKIIVCTNLSDEQTKNEVMELGADSIVLKSNLNPKDIIEIVK